MLTESPSVTEEEISHVENICNELIRKNLGVVVNIFNENTPFKELENVILEMHVKYFITINCYSFEVHGVYQQIIKEISELLLLKVLRVICAVVLMLQV